MSKLNVKLARPRKRNHEGSAVPHLSHYEMLRRSVLACLLWEDTFYEEGKTISERIIDMSKQVTAQQLAYLAVEARHQQHLRHVPLLLLALLCQKAPGSALVSETIARVISRADELSEFVAVVAELNGVTPDKVKPKLSAQAKKGLAKAFRKFDEYQLAKYNREGAVTLRDVMFLAHPKPQDKDQQKLWKRLIDDKLAVPDTWETQLSGGADKKKTFTRLIESGELGYFALLRNIRNMMEAGVDKDLVKRALVQPDVFGITGKDKILPFRFVAAARACPQLETSLDRAMLDNLHLLPSLPGKTAVLVDISPSMNDPLSAPKPRNAYSKRPPQDPLKRVDAACTLASIVNAEDLRVFSFATDIVEVAPRRGMAGVDLIRHSQPSNGTLMRKAIERLNTKLFPNYDRLIVITDEESQDGKADPIPGAYGYMINVSISQNGIGYGPQWTNISGFSENVLRYIHELEQSYGE